MKNESVSSEPSEKKSKKYYYQFHASFISQVKVTGQTVRTQPHRTAKTYHFLRRSVKKLRRRARIPPCPMAPPPLMWKTASRRY